MKFFLPVSISYVFTETLHVNDFLQLKLEKEIATHSSILAYRVLWMEEPSRLLSIRSHRVGHD